MQAVPSRQPVRSELDGVLDFFSSRILPHVEEAVPGGLRRSFRAFGRSAVIEIGVADESITLDSDEEEVSAVAESVAREAFDLEADTSSVRSVLGRDPHLESLVRAHPDVGVPGSFDATETAIRAVIGQQVSVAGANTLAGRLVERVGERLAEPSGAITHLFPAADRIATANLDGLGMPAARIDTVRSLATAIAEGTVDLRPDAYASETRSALLSLSGIGEWTVSYISMRVLRDRDAFMASDLGVRKGAAALSLPTSPRELEKYSERWRPFRAYAVMYLWLATH